MCMHRCCGLFTAYSKTKAKGDFRTAGSGNGTVCVYVCKVPKTQGGARLYMLVGLVIGAIAEQLHEARRKKKGQLEKKEKIKKKKKKNIMKK